MNLYETFAKAFATRNNKVALRVPDRGEELTFGELEALSARIANRLASEGALPGDRIAVQVEKSPEALALYLAVLRSGCIYLPLNTAYMPDELAYFVGNAEPTVVVTQSRQKEIFGEIQKDSGSSFTLLTLEGDGTGSLTRGLDEQSGSFETIPRENDDIAAILYTSGTTGRPKGAMISHGNLSSNAAVLSEYWGWQNDDVLLHALPIFHVHGLFVACNISLSQGSEMVFLPRFDLAEVLRQLPNSTVMMGVPTFYTRLLQEKEFGPHLLGGMRLFISGSAPLLEETFEEFYTRTGHQILERYGMTETGMNTSNPLNGFRIPGTVGYPLPGTDVRVVDEHGRELESEEVGSLQVKGPNVFSGYWRMPEKTASEFTDDGYFITGDLGKIDSSGYVSIVGREKDLIISGGYNIYPKEVEMVINDIDGVYESAVFAYKDSDFGEGVAAAIVPDNNADVDSLSIQKICKEKLAGYKVPRRIIELDELPRNTMGKVQKNVLRNQYGE